MLPACLATDRQTLTALTVVLLDDETDDLRERDTVEVVGVEVTDLAHPLLDILVVLALEVMFSAIDAAKAA